MEEQYLYAYDPYEEYLYWLELQRKEKENEENKDSVIIIEPLEKND